MYLIRLERTIKQTYLWLHQKLISPKSSNFKWLGEIVQRAKSLLENHQLNKKLCEINFSCSKFLQWTDISTERAGASLRGFIDQTGRNVAKCRLIY